MRDIRFRTWNEDTKKIYYFCGFTVGTDSPSTELRASMYNPKRKIADSNYLYKPEADDQKPILMQYTGLIDSKGSEIWEGDIYKTHGGQGVVEYNSEYGYWTACGHLLSHYNHEDGEVIGNIYENLELLN